MAKRAQTRFRRRTYHSKITTYDEFDRLRSCLLQLQQTRGGPRMDIKILKKPVLDDRAGKPVETSRSNYSQDYGLSWSSQVWKSGDGEHDRPGQLDKKFLVFTGEKLTLIVESIFSAGRRILQGTKRLFTIERGKPRFRGYPGKGLILKSSSWEVRQQRICQ